MDMAGSKELRFGGRVNPLSSALVLLSILSITTLFQPYPLFGNINKVFVFLVFACLVLSFFRMRFHQVYWLALIALCGLVCFDIYISTWQFTTANDPIYLPFWFLLMMVFSEGSDQVKEFVSTHEIFLKWVVGIWTLIVGVSIFLPSSYGAGWGDGTYFGSITHSVFRLAPCACLIQVFTLALLAMDRKNKNYYLLCQLVPLYCGFMGGSRTYFAVIALYFIIFLRYFADTKQQFYSYLLGAIFLGSMAFGLSGIGSKVAATRYSSSSYFDFWGTLTNGRSAIWETDFKYYFNTDPVSALFGSGYDMVYKLSLKSKLGAAVYAHNDFINLLIVNGLVGLLLYLIPAVALLKRFCTQGKASLAAITIVAAIWIVNAMFNMNYTYTCAAIAFGFLPSVIELASSKNSSVSCFDCCSHDDASS